MQTVDEKVRNLIAEQLGVDVEEVTDNAGIVADLNADSLDVVELVIAIEENFDISISDEDAEKLNTVQEVIDYVSTAVTQSR